MNPEDYKRFVKRYESVVRAKASKWQEEDSSTKSVLYSEGDELTKEDYLIEAAMTEVIPSEEISDDVELAEIYFECSDKDENDVPMNWRDYPANPADPLKENMEMIVDCIVRLDVLERVGIDRGR